MAKLKTGDKKAATGSVVKVCTCTHAFQDATYGKRMRLHTVGVGAVGQTNDKCTVCGRKN